MSEEKRLFDSTKEFVVRIQHPDFPDRKSCTLRFPTDEEWASRTKAEIRVSFGSGREENRNGDECSGQLFDKIRLDKDGPEFDEAEKCAAIARLESTKFISVERIGGRYRVTLKAAGAEVVHTLNGLTERQKRDFGKAAVTRTPRRNLVETRIRLEPSAELWAKLNPEVEGYISVAQESEGNSSQFPPHCGRFVPIIHKDVAVTEVLRQQQLELEDEGDPEA